MDHHSILYMPTTHRKHQYHVCQHLLYIRNASNNLSLMKQYETLCQVTKDLCLYLCISERRCQIENFTSSNLSRILCGQISSDQQIKFDEILRWPTPGRQNETGNLLSLQFGSRHQTITRLLPQCSISGDE